MPRRNTLAATTMLLCIAAESCQTLIGSVDVNSAPEAVAEPDDYTAAPIQALTPASPPVSALTPVMPPAALPPSTEAPVMGVALEPETPQPDAGAAPSSAEDAGVRIEPDAEPAPFVPRPVLVDPASDLERVGAIGGDPRLGSCAGGVAIGVRPTANPDRGTFGERLTFLELICGTVSNEAPGALRVERDDSLPTWDTSGSFEGNPPTMVPDPRVTWVVQPETLCPEAAPVLVGLSGTLDPRAPDDTTTDAIRSLSIECAPLALASNGVDIVAAASGHESISQTDSFATTGIDSYRSICDGGTVITRIRIDSGFWLDGFVLGCSSLHGPE
jgi:hypothetical protein